MRIIKQKSDNREDELEFASDRGFKAGLLVATVLVLLEHFVLAILYRCLYGHWPFFP